MNKNIGIAAIIALVVGAGYIVYTAQIYKPSGTEIVVPVVNTEDSSTLQKDEIVTMETKPVIKDSPVAISKDQIMYKNTDLGFSFNYPKTIGELYLKYYPTAETSLADAIVSFPKLSGVSIQGKNYDGGTDTPKKPICPDYLTCKEKVNKLGTKYYEATVEYMGGELLRREFPLSVDGSLVIQYDTSENISFSNVEKIQLDKLIDTVLVIE